jgi:hypothetical protein
MFFAQKKWYKWAHAGGGEKNGRIIFGNQRSRRNFGVVFGFIEVDVFLTEFL